MFASQSFEGDTTPDDLEPELLYNSDALLCAGIVVFDIFVANCDRYKGNIKVDNPATPSVIRLIDHERALFYKDAKEGIKRLKSRADRLGIADGMDSAFEWHCFVELIDSAENLSHWVRRVEDIPDWFLHSVCEEVKRLAITETEFQEVVAFLKARRDKLGQLILDNRTRFPKVKQWPLIL